MVDLSASPSSRGITYSRMPAMTSGGQRSSASARIVAAFVKASPLWIASIMASSLVSSSIISLLSVALNNWATELADAGSRRWEPNVGQAIFVLRIQGRHRQALLLLIEGRF